jgi:hypothetical protein
MRWRLAKSSERPISAVPRPALVVLLVALALHVSWQALEPQPQALGAALHAPPNVTSLRVASLGEPIALAQAMTLYLQAFDNQPGVSIPYRNLDYGAVIAWLKAILDLDPRSQYPLMMAAQLYAQVPDEARTRTMLEFVHEEFLQAPNERWRWLAHAALIAKHRLHDMPLALRYADDITRHAKQAQSWARQMRIFILEDMGESQAAAVLLGGLLDSGEVTDPAEVRFLSERLEKLKTDENSTVSSKSR